MAVISELIQAESDGTLSFGDYRNPKYPGLSFREIAIK